MRRAASLLLFSLSAYSAYSASDPGSIPVPVGADVPRSLAEWLACAAFMLFLVNEGRKFFRGFQGSPPNEQLSASHTALDNRTARNENSIRVLYKRIDEEREKLENKIDDKFFELARSADDGRNKLHARLDEMTRAIGRIEGKIGSRNHSEES